MMFMAKILLVEDDPMISEIYQRKFVASGFEVDTAMSASEVLEKAKENRYDLVLLDLVLPEMNGIEILEKIRGDVQSYDPALKVVIFSNLNDQENQDRALQLGAIGFIEKSSYNPTELVVEVQRILRETGEREKNKERRESTVFGEQRENTPGKKKILFIEDEDVFTEIFGDKFRDDGYVVDIVRNGQEGAEMAMEGAYDLIVTDMMLPGMKGDEVVRCIRENEKTKDTPILVLSASATDEEAFRVEQLGIQEFCLKTQATPSSILHKIQHILEREDTDGMATKE
jgi:DNA-binding response OmpR family regulator